MKKILITGGNGLLGANLAHILSEKEIEIAVLVRKNANVKVLDNLPVQIIYGNIDKQEDVSNAIKGCNYVVHSASITEQCGISFEDYERVNVTATKYVVQACLEYKVEKLIYVSTANTFGPGNLHSPGTELNGFTYFKANSGYINTKYLAQQYVLEQVLQKQLQAVIVNPTFMIGAYDSKPSSGQIILYGLKKKIIFYPPGGKNFVHIEDVCNGILNAIHFGKTGNCYLLAGENMSYRDFFRSLNKIGDQHPFMLKIPSFILKAGGRLSGVLKFFGMPPAKLNNTAAYMLCCDNYYSGKKSERELQLSYQPVTKAISAAYDWFNQHPIL